MSVEPTANRAPVAQWIEHLTSDQMVGGSNPSGRANTTTCSGVGVAGPLDLVRRTTSWATPMEVRICREHLTPSIRGHLTLPSQRAGHLILLVGAMGIRFEWQFAGLQHLRGPLRSAMPCSCSATRRTPKGYRPERCAGIATSFAGRSHGSE